MLGLHILVPRVVSCIPVAFQVLAAIL